MEEDTGIGRNFVFRVYPTTEFISKRSEPGMRILHGRGKMRGSTGVP
jgi:hypothetical protein